MTVNTTSFPTTISDTDKRALDQTVNTFNTQLKETQKVVSKNSLAEADFLTLLVTQLKTQDPTKPMDDKAFIGQMAQFTSLKQMSSVADNLNQFTKEFDFTKSVSLVGKEVSFKDVGGFTRSGKVDSVLVQDGNSRLKINGETIALGDVVEVMDSLPEMIAPVPNVNITEQQRKDAEMRG